MFTADSYICKFHHLLARLKLNPPTNTGLQGNLYKYPIAIGFCFTTENVASRLTLKLFATFLSLLILL